MSVVTISRQSYSPGKEVAEKVARKLRYDCISSEVLTMAAEEFDVPETKLLRAFRDAPSTLDRFTFGKETHLAYVQAALLSFFQKDNVVYHGLAGHYSIREISHVLKVRIIGKQEDRVELLMQRERVFQQAAIAMMGLPGQGTGSPGKQREMSEAEALRTLEDADEARRKWGLHLYGVETHDPSLYDLMVRVKKLSTEDAAEMICLAAGLDRFQTTPESQGAIDDLLVAARVKASLIERYHRVNVTAHEGAVYVGLEGASSSDEKEIRDTVVKIPGVEEVDVRSYPFVTPD